MGELTYLNRLVEILLRFSKMKDFNALFSELEVLHNDIEAGLRGDRDDSRRS
jgi:hypothetical protein